MNDCVKYKHTFFPETWVSFSLQIVLLLGNMLYEAVNFKMSLK